MNKRDKKDSGLHALGRLLRYARGYRVRITWASIFSIINKLFDIAPEILIGFAIDVVVNQETSFVAQLGYETATEQIVVLAILTFFVWVGESISEYIYLLLWRNLAQRLQSDLRLDTYDHVQHLDMAFFDRRSSGEMVSILNDDINQLERFLDGGANGMIQVLVSVVAVGAVFFAISPTIAFWAFTPIPFIIIGSFYFSRKAAPLYTEVRRRVGVLSSRLANNITGIATIKSFTAEALELKRLKKDSEAYVEANKKAIAISSAFIPVIRMGVLTGYLTTLVIGGFAALNGSLNIGLYGVLVFLTQRLLWPLTGLAEIIDLYARAMASTKRVLDLLETPIGVTNSGTDLLDTSVKDSVQIDKLSFTYQDSESGIKDISLTIPFGTTLALVGATGSGKSTLIKLLLRYYQPGSGSIVIGGKNIESLSMKALRETIGMVSQDVFLFDGTIRENIAYGEHDVSDEHIIECAKLAEAWEFIETLPKKLDSLVGERGVRLSGGQRQRIALARALVKDPPILILDEATSAVDNETEAAIQRSLKKISKDRTVIMIAHRLSTIVHAEQIAVIDKGVVVEMGTHEELVKVEGCLYQKQWAVQTGGTF